VAYDGTLKFDTAVDSAGFQKDTKKLGDIVSGLGVFKILEKGFEMVAASMDRAISRYDTMTKFPKVLENMGFSAEASAAATKKLADGVQGLPTALDDVVSTAQRLTVLTGNLENSTNTTLALNDAFLASGSGAADASRGLVQYTQMLSKGKVDMISWRTLQETMGYALQKTAEAFGYAGQSAQNELYAALLNGAITFDQFNTKLIELDQSVGGFAEMAKTSTGGIATAFTNMRTRIAAGVTEIISAIDSGLSETRFKSIENIISTTGTNIKNELAGVAGVFEFVASKADFLVPAIIAVFTAFAAYKIIGSVTTEFKTLTSIVKAAQTVMAASQGLIMMDAGSHTLLTAALASETKAELVRTAAKKAGMTIDAAGNLITSAGTVATAAETAAVLASSGALSAKTVIVGVLTGGISLATAAQWLWNAAMAANPIGLIVAGIALLVAAIIGLISWYAKSDEAYNEGRQYVEDYGKANKALADDLDKTTEEFKKNNDAAEATTRTSEDMLAGLSELADKGLARTAEETYRLQAKIDALNATQQGLNLTIDETTGKLSMTTAEIEAYFGATESAARATALTDHMKALGDQLVDIESQFIDSERQIEEWKEQVENGTLNPKKYEWLVGRLNKETDALKETQAAALDEMAQNEEAYSKVLADQEAKRQALADLQEDEIRDFAAQHHLSYESIRADMDENNLSFAEWVDENQKELDKSQAKLTEFADKWGYSLDEVNAAVSASGLTIEDYVERQDKALEHAMEVIADFTANATNGFSVMDQETAISLDNFMNNMKKNEDAVANWATNMNTLMDLGVNKGVIEQLSKMGPEGAAQAQAFVDELTKLNGGVDVSLGQTNDLVAAKLAEIDDSFSTSLDAANIAADTQLRAESYYGAGYASIEKIATGIADNPAAVDATTSQMEGAKAAASEVDFSEVGQNLAASIVNGLSGADVSGAMQGIADAIQSNTNKVTSAVTVLNTGVQTVLSNMKTQAVSTTSQTMTEISSTITSRNGNLNVAATAAASSVVNGLQPMVPGAEDVAGNMMDGIGVAMDRKAPYLYSKAREIANRIASTMAAALDVHSPSRVMVGLFENVMMGIYVAMDGMSGMLYSEAKNIADGIADRLTISGDVASTLVNKMRAAVESTSLGGAALVPQVAYAGGGGGSTYSPTLVQNITTPKPLSSSEMTREGQDMLRRSRWQLP